jgi:cytoskeletal protein CcmA (bactofilin family)
MWKFSQASTPAASSAAGKSSTAPVPSAFTRATSAIVQSSIGKGMEILGEITGSEPLFLDCVFVGSIDLPGNRLTIGANGQITASITARDVVVMGKVFGDIAASNLLEIRGEGAVTGNVTAARLSMEDGAFLSGAVDVEKTEAQMGALAEAEAAPAVHVPQRPVRPAKAESSAIHMQPMAQSA